MISKTRAVLLNIYTACAAPSEGINHDSIIVVETRKIEKINGAWAAEALRRT
jgi:hypothetical protein